MYETHTTCDKNGFVLETVVTPGNVHDIVALEEVYDKVTKAFTEIETVVADSAYKTPHICKKVFTDGRMLSTTNREGYREYKSDPKICVECPHPPFVHSFQRLR